jgi:hypothetical protein
MLRRLKKFFGVLKSLSAHIRFCFITGVSRTIITDSLTTITAMDLSMDRKYATIVGFTEKEVDKYFCDKIQHVADVQKRNYTEIRNEMRKWHYGFQFTGSTERVYNPCSVISYLEKEGRDKLFWSNSGGLSTVLAKKFMEFPGEAYNYVLKYLTTHEQVHSVANNSDLPPLEVEKSVLLGHVDAAEKSVAALQAILFHGGYLSIARERSGINEPIYSLRFSNLEVKFDYIERLSQVILAGQKKEYKIKIEEMKYALLTRNWDDFISQLKSLYAEIPYFLYSSKSETASEAMYQFQLYVFMIQAQFDVGPEALTSQGRADLVVISETTYIFELKLKKNKENPLDQCRDLYLPKYINAGREVACIGLRFAKKAVIESWGVVMFSTTGDQLAAFGPIKLTNGATNG